MYLADQYFKWDLERRGCWHPHADDCPRRPDVVARLGIRGSLENMVDRTLGLQT